MTWLSTILAATGALPAPKSTFAEILPVLLSLAGVVFVGFIALSVVRGWMRGEVGQPEQGFTLSDLRRLHREGKLSAEELQRAESQMISKVRATADNSDAIRIRPKSDLPHDRNDPESGPEPQE